MKLMYKFVFAVNFLKNKIISILDNAFPKFLSLQDITNSIEIKHPKKEINQVGLSTWAFPGCDWCCYDFLKM